MAEVAVSVVIPVFNESPNVFPQAEEIVNALDGYPGGFEVVFVDDGSLDDTVLQVKKAADQFPQVRLLSLGTNKGQVPAMAEGLRQALGGVLVTIDGDMQHDPEDIPALVAAVKSGYDMACGWRRNRQDPFLGKILPSLIFNRLMRLLFEIPIHDNSCTLRAYRPDAIRSIELYPYAISFIPVLAHRAGYKITEMVIRHRARSAGEAKYNSPGRFIYTFKEMFAIWFGRRDHLLSKGPKVES